jgi:hypothetical protein
MTRDQLLELLAYALIALFWVGLVLAWWGFIA